MKPICFLGTSKQDLAALPRTIRRRAGHELFMLQVGRTPADFRPMPDVGSGVCEIRMRDDAGAFRVMFVAKFARAIFVLHAFQKKTQRTPPMDLELARRRYRMIGERS